MYRILTTNQFEKDVKRCIKRGLSITLLRDVMEILEKTGSLPHKYKPNYQVIMLIAGNVI